MVEIELRRLVARLDAGCRAALEAAAGMAATRGHFEVSVEHLLLALCEQQGGEVPAILRHFDCDEARLRAALGIALEANLSGNAGRPVFSPLMVQLFRDAFLFGSLELGCDDIPSIVLLFAIAADPLKYQAKSWRSAFEAMSAVRMRPVLAQFAPPAQAPAGQAAEARKSQPSGSDPLQRFCTDFTKLARDGRIDPVFCRDLEIQQMIDILGRRRKNNPLCVGDAGVGKTAVVEGLALKIARGDVPEFLKPVNLLGLDLGLLQAGASVKGEFENRLQGVIEGVRGAAEPTILFIDEAHMLIGAGASAGGSDAANLLKPALARGEMRSIAATTWAEYKKYFEKDAALARRFQLVKLDEPDPDQAVTILRGLRGIYEEAHSVYIRDSAVEASARLSARYIAGRQLPDKAVDVLDTASARVRLSQTAVPGSLERRRQQILEQERALTALRRDSELGHVAPDARIAALEEQRVQAEAELAALEARYAEEREIVLRILDLRTSLSDQQSEATETDAVRSEVDALIARLREVQKGDPLVSFEVGAENVAEVIADWTGIPLGSMLQDEADAVLTLSDALRARVIGQEHAVGAVGQRVRIARANLRNPDAPAGVFLFVGPSGTGKTELATALADRLFGGERFMVRINMSEFQERHTVSKLIGSPPGYVGYGEGGLLTEAVRQRPYSVVLLDEVEKADPEVLNLFYQVFDKGILSDGEARAVDFRNTIIILTSNLGTDQISALFEREEATTAQITEVIRPVLSAFFKPALLARMEIVPFRPLAREALEQIVRLKLEHVSRRLLDNYGVPLTTTDEAIGAIVDRCDVAENGARNVDHVLNGTLLPALATELLSRMGEGGAQNPTMVRLTASNGAALAFEIEG